MAIRHKRKNSTGYTWQTGDLVEGQIGLNIADGTLHFDKADGSTVTIAANAVNGLPTGGLAGEYLEKNSSTNYDVSWTDRVKAKLIYENVKNVSGGSLAKGTPVYQVGVTGVATVTVAAARADDPAKVAIGVLDQTIADEAEGTMTILGEIKGVNTSGFSVGDPVYLGATGGFTNVAPTSSSVSVQFLGVVFRVDASNGSGFITGTLTPDQIRYTGTVFEFWNGSAWAELAFLKNVVEDTTPQLGGNLDVNGNSIVSTSNANITIAPDGTGDVVLSADTVVVGDSGAAATLTTNGAGNLTISTNSGTNAGTIVLAQGTNGNITITPNGTGVVNNVGVTVVSHTPASAGTNPILCRSIVTIDNSIRYGNLNLQKQRSDILLAAMTNEPAVQTYSVRDSANTNRIFASHRAVYQGTGTNPFFAFDVSVNGFTNTIDVLNMSNTQARFGNANTNYTITTNGTGDLTLSTNTGTNSGTVVINDGANGNIAVTPNGTGKTVITNAVPYEYVYTAGTTTGTITPNAANGTIQSITLTGSITFNAFTTPISGQTLTLIITQPASGGPYTLTSTMLFAGGSKTLSTAANAVDILTVSYIGTTYYASLAKGFA
jgi:hypothetical protein